MLSEISSSQFRLGAIQFHRGLNAVLGDKNATNSIGKTSLLLVIDFGFGGSSLVENSTDIVAELGDHDYFFTFEFDAERYCFCRGTKHPEVVYKCNLEKESLAPISLEEYKSFLKASYKIEREDLSFRSLVGLYSRVWGKGNLNVHRPLHNVAQEPSNQCVLNLIKTYGRYSSIRELESHLKKINEEKVALRKAFKNKILPKINKSHYNKNSDRIEEIEIEIAEIKSELAKFATNIKEIVNREIRELKVEKDDLLDERLKIASKLDRIDRNLSGNRRVKSRHFAALTHFFPEVDLDKIVEVESFHDGLVKILRSEFESSKNELHNQLEVVDAEIQRIDQEMGKSLNSLENPSAIVDRVHKVSSELDNAKTENGLYDKELKLRKSAIEAKAELSTEKQKTLKLVEDIINDSIDRLTRSIFGAERKTPRLTLSESNYGFSVEEDTGTGTAYSSLITFDLSVFETTPLPFLIHDSILYKNIENDSVGRLLGVYGRQERQSFIAIDEIAKYGNDIEKLMLDNSVILLSDKNVLYIKDWRK